MRLWISAWLAGEFLSLFLGRQLPLENLIIFMGIGICGVLYFTQRESLRIKKILLYGVASVCVCAAGFTWVEHLQSQKPGTSLQPLLEGRVLTLRGYIDELPRRTDKSYQFGFHVTQAELAHHSVHKVQEITIPQRVSLLYPAKDLEQDLIPGQYWQFKVKLKQIHGLKNPYGFDLEQWLYIQNYGAQGIIQGKNNQKLNMRHQSFSIWIELLRLRIRQKIQRSLGAHAPYVGVISALVMGEQNMISTADWQIFAQTGIGHLISISGLHVTMLAALGARLTSECVRHTRLIHWQPAQYMAGLMGFCTAFLYTWLAGFQIPAQRTMMMVGIATLGLYLGRMLHMFDIWFWALFLVLTCNPWAVFAPGFWLSFGAVAAILFAMPKDSRVTSEMELIFIKKLQSSLQQATRVQAVVTLALIPFSLYWFFQISLISPIANALAIPIVSFVVTPCAMLGAFLPWYFGDLFLWLAHTVFEMLMFFVRPLAHQEWSAIHGPKPPAWHLLVAIIGVLVCIRPGALLPTWKSRTLGFVVCCTLWLPREYIPELGIPYGELEMTVWDIGQGNAVLIQTQSHQLVFDTGPTSFGKFNPGEKIILPHLHAAGIKHIDQLVISHQDADHVGGLQYMLEHFPVHRVMGSIAPDHRLHTIFKKNRVPLEKCQVGQQWTWDGVEFRIWHPQLQEDARMQYQTTQANEMSCVLEIRQKFFSIWLTGDVEKKGESLIVGRLQDSAEQLRLISEKEIILMAPHHGSKTSSTPLFLETLQPQKVFSQTGYQNRYHHPNQAVVERYHNMGIPLQDTVKTGAQTWRSHGPHMELMYYRLPKH